MCAWLAILATTLGGCLESGAVCDDGRVCAIGQVCNSNVCIEAAQVDACAPLAENDPCNFAGEIGICRDNACVGFACGDGIIAGAERCETDIAQSDASCLTRGFDRGVVGCDSCGDDLTDCGYTDFYSIASVTSDHQLRDFQGERGSEKTMQITCVRRI